MLLDRLREGFAAVERLLGELEKGTEQLIADLQDEGARIAEGAETFAQDLALARERVAGSALRATDLGLAVDRTAEGLAAEANVLGQRERDRAEGLASAAGIAAGAVAGLERGAGQGAALLHQGAGDLEARREPVSASAREAEGGLGQARARVESELGRTGDAAVAASGQSRGAVDAARAAAEAFSGVLARDSERTVPGACGQVRDFVNGPFVAEVDRIARQVGDRVRRAAEGWRREAHGRADAFALAVAEEHVAVTTCARVDLPRAVEEPTRERATPALRDVAEGVAESRRETERSDGLAAEYEPVLPAMQTLKEFAEGALAGTRGGELPASINATETYGDKILRMVREQGYQDMDPDYGLFRPPAGEEDRWKRYGDGRWVKVEEGDPAGGSGFRAEDLPRDRASADDLAAMVRERGYQDLDPGYALFRPPAGQEDRWRRTADGRWLPA